MPSGIGFLSPHLLTLPSSVLALFLDTAFTLGWKRLPISQGLFIIIWATPAKVWLSHFSMFNRSPRIVSVCRDWVTFLTISNHYVQGQSALMGTSGVLGRLTAPEPQGQSGGHGMIPRRTEYCHQRSIGQVLDRKREQLPLSQHWWQGQKES